LFLRADLPKDIQMPTPLQFAHRFAACLAALFALTACSRGYSRGTVLQYLPNDCASYRVYVDVKSLTTTLHLEESLKSDHLPAPWKSIVQTFESAKLRPGQEIEELAVCAQQTAEDDDDISKIYVAIGGRFGGRDALHKYKSIIQGLTHAKDSEVLEKVANGTPYLVSSYTPNNKWIAMPAANVLVFYTDDVAQIASIAKPHTIDANAWRLETKTLASFDSNWAGHPGADFGHSIKGVLVSDHADLVFDAVAVSDYAAKTNALTLGVLKTALAAVFAASDFASLADSIRAMTLDVNDRALHVKLEIPVAKMIDAEALATSKPQSLTDLFGRLSHTKLPR
jgi:hypothetical protein